eukprot:9489070-Pyramimonas_sp.AAC.1
MPEVQRVLGRLLRGLRIDVLLEVLMQHLLLAFCVPVAAIEKRVHAVDEVEGHRCPQLHIWWSSCA